MDDDMKLPDGCTCGGCLHWRRCSALMQALDQNYDHCDFAPSRYVDRASHESYAKEQRQAEHSGSGDAA